MTHVDTRRTHEAPVVANSSRQRWVAAQTYVRRFLQQQAPEGLRVTVIFAEPTFAPDDFWTAHDAWLVPSRTRQPGVHVKVPDNWAQNLQRIPEPALIRRMDAGCVLHWNIAHEPADVCVLVREHLMTRTACVGGPAGRLAGLGLVGAAACVRTYVEQQGGTYPVLCWKAIPQNRYRLFRADLVRDTSIPGGIGIRWDQVFRVGLVRGRASWRNIVTERELWTLRASVPLLPWKLMHGPGLTRWEHVMLARQLLVLAHPDRQPPTREEHGGGTTWR